MRRSVVCETGKRYYRTKGDARRDVKQAMKYTRRRLRPYRCPHCGYFHLTSQKPR
jgi:hypothetical protein